ncbi:hypothetical protein PENTCL1PPCAC_11790, partial [Pristionchus entomophagus]
SILLSLLLISLISSSSINAETPVELASTGVDVRAVDGHPKDVRRAVASSESHERVKRVTTCGGEGFWEKTGFVVLSLFVNLRGCPE